MGTGSDLRDKQKNLNLSACKTTDEAIEKLVPYFEMMKNMGGKIRQPDHMFDEPDEDMVYSSDSDSSSSQASHNSTGNGRRRLQDSSSSIPEDLTRRVMSGPDGAQRKQNLHNRWADQIAANRRIEQAAELQTIRDNAAAARGTWSPSRRRLDSSAFPPFA